MTSILILIPLLPLHLLILLLLLQLLLLLLLLLQIQQLPQQLLLLLYHGLPITQIKRLQHVQNGLARAVTRTPKHSHICPLRKSLHWLKVEQRIQYKIISITHNLLHITLPKYLHRLINIKPPSRTRSSDHLCLSFHLFLPGSSLQIDHSATPLTANGTLYQ